MEIGKVYVSHASDGIDMWFAPLQLLKNGAFKGVKCYGTTSTKTSKPVSYVMNGGSRFEVTDDVPPKLEAAIEKAKI